MKAGLRWLQDYITIPWDAEELGERLTAIGTAVDKIEPVFARFEGVVAARIKSVDPHPSRPDIHVLHIDHGAGEVTVVAGAPNCRTGLIVPYAKAGAVLPGPSDEPLGVRSIEGVESVGMCCSERDLGLSDDHSGLFELDGEEISLGADLWEALELDELSLSFELTPNRSDCLSVLGIAREIGALVGSRIRRPEIHLTEFSENASDHLTVEIEDIDGCPRYAGRLVRGGSVKQSPFWLKRRLIGAGMRPISNAVDITNFVMLETGQPLHAFDWSTFSSGKVVVKPATAGEEYRTLDGEARRLPADGVMITDGARSVAIGGVMGGQDSEVAPETTDFLIESAYFNPSRIRRTRTKLGLATDSALRFEKGVDPNGVPYALDRAAALFIKLTGGELLAGSVDNYPAPIEPTKLELDPIRTNLLLGTNMSTPTMIDLLSQIEFGVTPGRPVVVTVPTFRPDVTRPVDLIEEIGRLYGFEKIPVTRRAAGVVPTHRTRSGAAEARLRTLLEGMGFTEIVCNSLVDPARMVVPDIKPVALRNPLSADLAVMRPDPYGSLLTVVAHNRNRRVDSIAVYELGKRFYVGNEDQPFGEDQQLLLGLCGQMPTAGWDGTANDYDFFELKGAVTGLSDSFGLNLSVEPSDHPPFMGGAGFIVYSQASKPIGSMGQIDPARARVFGVKDPVWVAVLDFQAITPSGADAPQYSHLPRFPAVYRDLAVVVGSDTLSGDIEAAVREAGGDLVDSVRLFDRYTGAPIPEGKLSLAYAITYRRDDRTLTDPEVDELHSSIVGALAKRFGAELRS